MSRRNAAVDAIVRELAGHGIFGRVETTGTNHLRVRFQFGGVERQVICSNTPGCHHGFRNARADVRRILRAAAPEKETPTVGGNGRGDDRK